MGVSNATGARQHWELHMSKQTREIEASAPGHCRTRQSNSMAVALYRSEWREAGSKQSRHHSRARAADVMDTSNVKCTTAESEV